MVDLLLTICVSALSTTDSVVVFRKGLVPVSSYMFLFPSPGDIFTQLFHIICVAKLNGKNNEYTVEGLFQFRHVPVLGY